MIILIMLADILIMNLSSLPNCKLVCTTGKLVGVIGKLESTNISQIQACQASLDQACLASLFQLDTKNVWSSLYQACIKLDYFSEGSSWVQLLTIVIFVKSIAKVLHL